MPAQNTLKSTSILFLKKLFKVHWSLGIFLLQTKLQTSSQRRWLCLHLDVLQAKLGVHTFPLFRLKGPDKPELRDQKDKEHMVIQGMATPHQLHGKKNFSNNPRVDR